MKTIKYKDTGTEARVAGLLRKRTSKGKNNTVKVWFCHQCPCYMMPLHRSKGVTVLEQALLYLLG